MNEFSMRDDAGTGGCPRSRTSRAGFGLTRLDLGPQPSLRVPVTPANRDYLRRLRASEAVAWEMGKDLRQTVLELPQAVAIRRLPP